jgi:UDPglucose 6-dehydrogenase
VIGGHNTQAIKKVMDLYRDIEHHQNPIASRAGLSGPAEHVSQYVSTGLGSAELIKVTANAFLALKISFANSIAKLADKTNADINEVMDAVGADHRIGRSFLNAGRGYGGGCFPKDVSGLISSATDYGVELNIMTAASDLNESMPGYIANKAQAVLGNLQRQKVAVLGLAFKAGTSDARKSPGVKLANILAHSGASVRAYDPQAIDEAKADLRKGITICDNITSCIKETDAIFITTEWPELIELDLTATAKTMKGNLLVDCMNLFNKDDVIGVGLRYIGVGR